MIDTVDMSWVWAAGGYVATLSEQCEWVKALVATGEVPGAIADMRGFRKDDTMTPVASGHCQKRFHGPCIS